MITNGCVSNDEAPDGMFFPMFNPCESLLVQQRTSSGSPSSARRLKDALIEAFPSPSPIQALRDRRCCRSNPWAWGMI